MLIPAHLEKTSQASHHLNGFVGKIATIVHPLTPAKVARLEKYLPFIFWRWYHLETSEGSGRPYDRLQRCHQQEKWPEDSQFLISPSLGTANNPSAIKIELSLDLISFDEQPFVVDYSRQLKDLPFQYQFDDLYEQLIQGIIQNIPLDQIADISAELPHQLIFLGVGVWYTQFKDLQKRFDPEEWLNYWHLILQHISEAGEAGYSTDVLLDSFTGEMRQVLPEYSLFSEDLGKLDLIGRKSSFSKRQRKQTLEQFDFWLNFCRYFLIPLSLYCPLIAPVYTDQETFRSDVEMLLNGDYPVPEPLFTPPTILTLTSFGKRLFT